MVAILVGQQNDVAIYIKASGSASIDQQHEGEQTPQVSRLAIANQRKTSRTPVRAGAVRPASIAATISKL